MADREHAPGAFVRPDGGAGFCVWAPNAGSVAAVIGRGDRFREIPLDRGDDGYFSAFTSQARAGDRYGFRLDGHERILPDPRSRYQPDGVHGLSELTPPVKGHRRDADWTGHALQELVIYELHVGTFTTAGTFQAAISRLDELVELGITAVELMPLAQCAGRWNWGYDGVNLFAVNHLYGPPEDLRALVGAAHLRGLAVIIDVVYNHLGPEGNYLSDFGPYFTNRYSTLWGPAVNFDGPPSGPVREFVVDNALFWLREYHVDGLRLDATRTLYDASSRHILEELKHAVQVVEAEEGRKVHLIAENNLHEPHLTDSPDVGGYGLDAQWCDDLGHTLLATLGQPGVFGGRSYAGFSDLQAVLRQGYSYRQSISGDLEQAHDAGRARLSRLVVSLQNHDMVGNHPAGKRVSALAGETLHRAAIALVLLYPAIPLIFMGEESGSERPFRFFADFSEPALRHAVERGRAAEFTQHDWSEAVSPVSPEAFLESKLPATATPNAMRFWYRQLLATRRDWQDEGVLDERRLRVDVDEASETVLLHYAGTDTAEAAFVLVRLAKDKTSAAGPIVRLSGKGSVLAHSSAAGLTGKPEPLPAELAPGDVLIGRKALAVQAGTGDWTIGGNDVDFQA